MKFIPSSLNPVLTVGAVNDCDGRGAFRPSVVQYDGKFLVWYTGQTTNTGTPYLYQTCFALLSPSIAKSGGFLKLEKHPNNPVIPCGAIPWSTGSNAEASVLYINDKTVLMAFSATNERRCWGNIGLGFNRYFDADYNVWEFEQQPLLAGTDGQAYGNPHLLKERRILHLFFSKYRGGRQVWHMQSPFDIDNLRWTTPKEIRGYRDNLPVLFKRGITDWSPFYNVEKRRWFCIARLESALHLWSSPTLADGGVWTYESSVLQNSQSEWDARFHMGGSVIAEWTSDPCGNEGRNVYVLWYDGQNSTRTKNQSGIAFAV